MKINSIVTLRKILYRGLRALPIFFFILLNFQNVVATPAQEFYLKENSQLINSKEIIKFDYWEEFFLKFKLFQQPNTSVMRVLRGVDFINSNPHSELRQDGFTNPSDFVRTQSAENVIQYLNKKYGFSLYFPSNLELFEYSQDYVRFQEVFPNKTSPSPMNYISIYVEQRSDKYYDRKILQSDLTYHALSNGQEIKVWTTNGDIGKGSKIAFINLDGAVIQLNLVLMNPINENRWNEEYFQLLNSLKIESNLFLNEQQISSNQSIDKEDSIDITPKYSSTISYDRDAAYNSAQTYWGRPVNDCVYYYCTVATSCTSYSSCSSHNDCAHFASHVLSAGGIDDGHIVNSQSLSSWFTSNGYGTLVSSQSALKKGDIIFYSWDGGPIWDHTAVVIANNGNGDVRIAEHSFSYNGSWDHWNLSWANFGGPTPSTVKYGFLSISDGGDGSDTTPPSGGFNNPSEGATISSRTVRIDGWGQDNSGGSGFGYAHFTADYNGSWHVISPDFTSSPFGFDWDMCSAGVPNGTVTLGLDIWDEAGNVAYSPGGVRHFYKNYDCGSATGTWHADYYDTIDRWWDWNNGNNYKCDENLSGPTLDKNYGTSGPCGMDGDTWIGEYTATINFPSGNYVFVLEHDDGMELWLNGANIAHRSGSSGANDYVCPARNLSGNTNLKAMLREDGGDARIKINWTTDSSVCNPPAGKPTITAPTNGQAFTEGQDINLAWTSTGDSYYGEIWGGPGGTLTFDWQTSTSRNIGSQWPGYTYSFHVKAKNSVGPSDYSDTVNFIVKPKAPTNLSATGASCTSINLSWSDQSGSEEGFKIYRNGSLLSQTSSGVTSYTDSNASQNTSYSYVVKAFKGSIESDASNTSSVTTTQCPVVPSVPTNVSASDGTYTDKIRISWNASSGTTYYEVYRNTSNSSNGSVKQSSPTSATYDDTNVLAGTTYYYYVKACNGVGCSGFSSGESGYKNITAPATPGGVSATDGSFIDKIRISWNASSGATYYEIYRNTNNSSSGSSLMASPSGSPYDDMSVAVGIPYYYYVKACNAGGCSGFSTGDSGFSNAGTDAADFVSQSAYPTVEPGKYFEIYFEIKNTGTSAWTPGSYVLQNLQNPLGANEQQALSGNVAPDENYQWVINMQAPITTGNYRSQWMISHNGTEFGPNMYIDVTVAVPGSVDDYEEDDNYDQANIIEDGLTQEHSIVPTGDVDWVMFTLTEPSSVTLETTGTTNADTVINLFDAYAYPMEGDDDGGVDRYSFIDRVCGIDELPAGTYYVTIEEYGNNDEISSYNIDFKITGRCTGIPLPPTNVSATDGSFTDKVRVSWAASSGATYYEVYRNTSDDSSSAIFWNTTTELFYDNTNAVPGTTYWYFIKSCNEIGCSAYSASDSGYMANGSFIPIPVKPSGTIIDRTPTFKWTKVSGATRYSYQLYTGTTLVYTKNPINPVCDVTYCKHTPVTTLGYKSYKWRVRAYVGGVWKPWSEYKTFTIARSVIPE